MDKQLEQQLVKKFPLMFKRYQNDKDGVYAIFYGIETGNGWYALLDRLLTKLQKHVQSYSSVGQQLFIISQIKEKFGQLRVYLDNADSWMQDDINAAAEEAIGICVKCSSTKNVTRNTEGFIRTLCEDCMKEFAKNDYHLQAGEL